MPGWRTRAWMKPFRQFKEALLNRCDESDGVAVDFLSADHHAGHGFSYKFPSFAAWRDFAIAFYMFPIVMLSLRFGFGFGSLRIRFDSYSVPGRFGFGFGSLRTRFQHASDLISVRFGIGFGSLRTRVRFGFD